MKKLLFIAVTLMTIASCSKSDSSGSNNTNTTPPTVNFSYTLFNNNLHAPATINFSNTSTNYTSNSWSFGNGQTSSSTNPSNKFSNAGSFNVTLTAYNSSNNTSASNSQNVTILAPYTQVKITEIKLTSISKTSSFTGFFKMTDANGNQIYKSANTTINPAQLPKTFQLTTPQLFSNISATYFVEVYEYFTLSPDVLISRTAFIPSLYNKGTSTLDSYPSSIDGVQGISLTLNWL